MSVLVFGHRNPDTDAICSAIAYADLLQQTTRPDAIAACCGPPNKRTEYVLARAGLPAPRMVMDVRPSAEDICRREIVTAQFGDSFHDSYQRMQAADLRAIPVIDDARKVVGVLSVLHLMDLFFHDEGDPIKSRTVTSCLQKIHDVLGGSFQHVIDPQQRDELLVMVGAMSAEGFTDRMKQFPAERLIVVCGDRPSIQLPAIEHGVRALVLTGGFRLSSGLVELAKIRKVSVIISPFDTLNTTLRIKSSQFIDPVVDTDVVTVPAKASVVEARATVERSAQPVFPVVDDDGVLVGLSFKSDLVNPPRQKLILVDHNELAQAVSGAEDAEIVEVLDHHRLGGGLKSMQPIRFINEPVGSTCTLVARQFRASGLEPRPAIALCMASGIISDTLLLRSPTTTDVDRDVLAWLRGLCPVDLDQYAREFFEIGSALRSSTPAEVIGEDCKEFSEQNVRFSISQIEETGFDLFWERKDDLRKALEDFATRQRLDFSALLVTDVVSNGSLLLLSQESEAWEEINYPRLDRCLYSLKNVVSRKKQLLPLLSRLIAESRA
ncbi:MAG: putative manganese-dependent inorganic diphosphatase [Planctomycetota bacterium]|nr:MAG: putative manganese-dependent inorganic diphosphatase [Planctomycetota bacterium]